MQVHPDCYPCLKRLAHQASSLATNDQEKSEQAYRAATTMLDRLFQPQAVSIVIASAMHQAIRDTTHNPDPYLPMKKREIELARLLAPATLARNGSSLPGLVRSAAQGNSIDFFRSPEEIREDLIKELIFRIDDTARLAALLAGCRNILYLADNTGEAYFDLPLYKHLGFFGRATYVLKESPVQNDITREDLAATGLKADFSHVMTTGTATPGIDMKRASPQFTRALKAADLIVAKGMGYYESLPEYGLKLPVFYCLKAKCGPVAQSLSVPVGSYVAKLVLPV